MGRSLSIIKLKIPLLRLYALVASSIIVILLLSMLAIFRPKYLEQEAPDRIIYSQFDIKYDPPIIIPPEEIKKAQIENNEKRIDSAKSSQTPNPIIVPNNRNATPSISLNDMNNNQAIENNSTPRIATNTAAPSQNSGAASNNNNRLPSLSAPTQNTIFIAECEKADPLERPPNCPVNAKVRKMVEINNGPRYRSERVQGYTNSEVNAKYFAGWRERCQTNEGYQAQVCIPLGKKPPRVKTPQELCLEQGLSHCNGVPMPVKETSQEKQ